jgi:hypothetical protein
MTKEQILTRLIKEDNITISELLTLMDNPSKEDTSVQYPPYMSPYTSPIPYWYEYVTTSHLSRNEGINDAFKSYDPKDYKENK